MSHLSVDTHFLLYSTLWEWLESFWPSTLLCLMFRRRVSILWLCPTSITSPLIIIPSSFSPWSLTFPVSVYPGLHINKCWYMPTIFTHRHFYPCLRPIEWCCPCPQCSLSSTSTCCGRERRSWATLKSTAKWNKHAASAPHNVDWPCEGKGGGRQPFQSKLGWFKMRKSCLSLYKAQLFFPEIMKWLRLFLTKLGREWDFVVLIFTDIGNDINGLIEGNHFC